MRNALVKNIVLLSNCFFTNALISQSNWPPQFFVSRVLVCAWYSNVEQITTKKWFRMEAKKSSNFRSVRSSDFASKKYPFLVLCLIQPDSTVFCKLCLLGEKTTILFCNNRCKLHRGVVFIDLWCNYWIDCSCSQKSNLVLNKMQYSNV